MRFLESMGISFEQALFEHRLAPLPARRDMAMLGLLHRVVLGAAPAQFGQFFPYAHGRHFPRGFRGVALRHDRQLHDPIDGSCPAIMCRSVFSLIYAYNLLPQHVVASPTAKSFQSCLQRGLKKACSRGLLHWQHLFVDGVRALQVHSFQSLFA